MGWADCGIDSKGRPIGYAFEATCDHLGCNVKIDRGLAYACGGMHGEEEHYCEKYFCSKHLFYMDGVNIKYPICKECSDLYIKTNYYKEATMENEGADIMDEAIRLKKARLDELEKYVICYDRTSRIGKEKIAKLKEEITELERIR